MVEVAPHPDVKATLGDVVGDLNIYFTRLLTYSEHRSLRRLYDVAIRSILRDFHRRVVIPLKQSQGIASTEQLGEQLHPEALPFGAVQSAFVGHSFAPADRDLVAAVIRLLQAFNIRVETGERPAAASVSLKVRRRIDRCDAFVGIFSRRDKLTGRKAYSTSMWIVDEKAYAFGKDKKLILIKDELVDSIGGLQGDYEYIAFDPENLSELLLRLVEMLTGRD